MRTSEDTQKDIRCVNHWLFLRWWVRRDRVVGWLSPTCRLPTIDSIN